ncbi:MAG: hypothetical protein IPI44_21230 [Sulfuritalea sp.]|nr:hypothetical protein [Sulfuritalea sp.]
MVDFVAGDKYWNKSASNAFASWGAFGFEPPIWRIRPCDILGNNRQAQPARVT